MAEQQQRVVGIDLGTTNSLVATMEGDTPLWVIPGEDGAPIVPSVVAFDQETKEGFAVGNAARDVLLKQPGNAVYSVKRLMGRDIDHVRDESEAVFFRSSWPIIEAGAGAAPQRQGLMPRRWRSPPMRRCSRRRTRSGSS